MSRSDISLLYVEDDEELRGLYTDFFKRRADRLFIAENGEQGLALYREHHPDLVVTDIRMPVMDGIEMIRHIKELDQDATIIVLSAFNDQDYLHQAINLGVTRYTLKPLDRRAFRSMLGECIELVELRREREENTRKLREAYYNIESHFQLIDKHLISSETDLEGRMVYASQAFCAISGHTREELLRHGFSLLHDPEMDRAVYDDLWATLRRQETWVGEFSNLDKQGRRYWTKNYIKPKYDHSGDIVGYTQVAENITTAKLLELRSITDQLTGVFNRHKMVRELAREFKEFKRYGRPFSIIMADIDHFKRFNDRYGHQVGDEVLVTFTSILQENVREVDVLARWGGEEFLILSPGTNLEGAREMATKLCTLVDARTAERAYHITASFGVSQCMEQDATVDDLLHRADQALYRAKDQGRNQVEACDGSREDLSADKA